MKRLRLSGSTVFDTCSAETTVPWMTSRSSSASRMALANCSVRCGRDRRARRDAGLLDLADALADQLGLDRLGVDLLHPRRGLVGVELGDLLEQRLGVLVAGPQALEVEHADAAEPADLDGGGRADDAVHGRAPSAAGRSGRRRSPRRCRRPRGRGCAGSGRWRCRRTRRPAGPTCRSRSRPQPLQPPSHPEKGQSSAADLEDPGEPRPTGTRRVTVRSRGCGGVSRGGLEDLLGDGRVHLVDDRAAASAARLRTPARCRPARRARR